MAGDNWLFGSNSLFGSGFNTLLTGCDVASQAQLHFWSPYCELAGHKDNCVKQEKWQKQLKKKKPCGKAGPAYNVTFYVLDKSLVQLKQAQKKLFAEVYDR